MTQADRIQTTMPMTDRVENTVCCRPYRIVMIADFAPNVPLLHILSAVSMRQFLARQLPPSTGIPAVVHG